jgi:hypothetical protein
VRPQEDYFGGVDADRAELDDISAKLDQLAARAAEPARPPPAAVLAAAAAAAAAPAAAAPQASPRRVPSARGAEATARAGGGDQRGPAGRADLRAR